MRAMTWEELEPRIKKAWKSTRAYEALLLDLDACEPARKLAKGHTLRERWPKFTGSNRAWWLRRIVDARWPFDRADSLSNRERAFSQFLITRLLFIAKHTSTERGRDRRYSVLLRAAFTPYGGYRL